MDLAEAVSPEQSGTRLAERDTIEQALRKTQIIENLNELALAPAKARSYNAMARLHEAQAGIAEQEARSGQDFARILGDDPLERLETFAGTLSPAKGLKLLEGVATIRQKQSAKALADARTERQVMLRQAQVLDQIGGIYRGADTLEKWKEAHQLAEQLMGEPSPLLQVPFQPGIGTMLSSRMLKEKDRMSLEIQNKQLERATQADAQRKRQIDAQMRVLGARERILNQTYENIVKNEGERSPAALELQRERTRSSKALADLRDLKLRGTSPEKPITSLPDKAERLPGRWYTLPLPGNPIGRWHPNGLFYKQGEPFPALPRTPGGGLSGIGSSALDSIMRVLNPNLPDAEDDLENEDAD